MAIVEVYLIEAPSEEGAVTEGDWGSSSVNECYFLQVTVKSKFERIYTTKNRGIYPSVFFIYSSYIIRKAYPSSEVFRI